MPIITTIILLAEIDCLGDALGFIFLRYISFVAVDCAAIRAVDPVEIEAAITPSIAKDATAALKLSSIKLNAAVGGFDPIGANPPGTFPTEIKPIIINGRYTIGICMMEAMPNDFFTVFAERIHAAVKK